MSLPDNLSSPNDSLPPPSSPNLQDEKREKKSRKPSMFDFLIRKKSGGDKDENNAIEDENDSSIRRKSSFIDTIFRRRKSSDKQKSNSQENFIHSEEYENICSVIGDISMISADKEFQASKASDGFTTFFKNIKSSPNLRGEDINLNSWIPPESWASKPFSPITPITSPRSDSSIQSDTSPIISNWTIRVYRMMDIGSEYVFVMVPCTLSTTASEFNQLLQGRFQTNKDLKNHKLFVLYRGETERLLNDNDCPAQILKNLLLEIGYSENDNLAKISREDHSYICRFVYHAFPIRNLKSNEYIQSDGKIKITEKFAFLAEEKLAVIPVMLFNFKETIESIDLSKNPVLSLPSDLLEEMPNLRVLRLNGNYYDHVPDAITNLSKLTHLELSNNNLGGDVFKSLQNCTSLTHLNLSSNQINFISEELSKLTNLRTLDLSLNSINTFSMSLLKLKNLFILKLPLNSIEDIPDQINLLKDLRFLDLQSNFIKHIPLSISDLHMLKHLDLRGNLIEDFFEEELTLMDLSELELGYNQIKSLKSFQMPFITEIDASHNPISMIEFTHRLEHLKIINLSVCKLTFIPDDLFDFIPNLEILKLDKNKLESLPLSINNLRHLRQLSAYDNQISKLDLGLGNLSKLRYLDLHANNLKTLPGELWLASNLQYLNLSTNFISEFPSPLPSISFSHLEDVPLIKSLEKLLISENEFVDGSFDGLYTLSKLSVLNISYNKIFDLGFDIGKLEKLSELYISGNNITNIPDSIEKLQKLHLFYANGNKLTNIPSELTKNRHLAIVDLSCNNLRYNISNFPFDWHWRHNKELCYLNLANNTRFIIPLSTQTDPRTKQIITHFSDLKKLRVLNVSNINADPSCFPDETVSLRVHRQTMIPSTKGQVSAISEYFGRNLIFDQYDFAFIDFLEQEGDCLFGLFDGKGSDFVSFYLKDALPEELEAELQKLKSQETISEAIRRTFLKANRDLSLRPIKMVQGASAVLVYTLERRCFVANVGDIMAILSREGKAITLTTKHLPWIREEQERIRKLSGFISSDGLIERECSVTRGFGFHHLLPFVISNPDVMSFDITSKEEFIILAPDSFWKHVSYQTAVDIARTERNDLLFAAQKLRDMAIAFGAYDSFTVMIIDLVHAVNVSINQGGGGGGNLGSNNDLNEDVIIPTPILTDVQIAERRRRNLRNRIADQSLSRLEAEIPPPQPPCAFVFTDIRASTRLWEKYHNAMRAAIKLHNQLLRRLLRNYGGYEIKTEGDAFIISFGNIVSALKWAINSQLQLLDVDWPAEILTCDICEPIYSCSDGNILLYKGLSVRMGIHYGYNAICEPDNVTHRMDYLGMDIILACRVCSTALGGQILISKNSYEAFMAAPQKEKADFDIEFVSLGKISLKGIEQAEEVWAAYPKELIGRFRERGMSSGGGGGG